MYWSWFGVYAYFTFLVLRSAYSIRLGAINEYGNVIHEFDPYFNFRATEVRIIERLVFDSSCIDAFLPPE